MKIKPVGDKILVMPIANEEQQLGSIVLPGTANAELSKGEVLDVSPELEGKYKVGEIVLFPTRCGVGQIINGKGCLWLKDTIDEIWGKLVSETES